jgi:hypothetical protein
MGMDGVYSGRRLLAGAAYSDQLGPGRPMTLAQLINANPELFYTGQEWYRNEDFVHASLDLDGIDMRAPSGFTACPFAREFGEYHALVLAACYVQHPNDPTWAHYLWTSDVDRYGQRVFVGGVSNGRGFEIHRHLHISERWGHAQWH